MVGIMLPKRPPKRKPRGQHPLNALTPAFVRNVNQAGRYCDGQGLYLDVRPTGSRGWIQRLTIRGRRTELGLGGFPLVSLKEAREKAFANRKLARDGGDPRAANRRAESMPSFADAAGAVWKQLRPGWRSPRHARLWLWKPGALRLASYREDTDCGGDERGRDRNPGSDLAREGRHCPEAAPAHPRSPGVGRGDGSSARQPLRPDRSGAWLRRGKPCVTCGRCLTVKWRPHSGRCGQSNARPVLKLMFEFLVLTATRSGEVRGAAWEEVDQEEGVWAIPAPRTKVKSGAPRSVGPTSVGDPGGGAGARWRSAHSFFRGWVESPSGSTAMSDLLRALRIAAVPHGFRSSFPGLGGGGDGSSARGGGGSFGAQGAQPGRGGLPEDGPVRAAEASHGRLGELSSWRESATGVRPAPLIRRGGPFGRLRDLAFEPVCRRSVLTAETRGSAPDPGV